MLFSRTRAMTGIWYVDGVYYLLADPRDCQDSDTALMAYVCRKATSYGSQRCLQPSRHPQQSLQS
jgi:hypothetical protein